MARPRSFDEGEVVTVARGLFAARGYFGTSIDDLVVATGLQRGSLYKAFGSKRNLFELALRTLLVDFQGADDQADLLTVALKELATEDAVIAKICEQITDQYAGDMAELLGANLLSKLKG